jgi:EpsI family protein
MKKNKHFIVVIVLLMTILVTHSIPQAKYVGTNFISGMDVPLTIAAWQGTDVSKALNINTANADFNFIDQALAHNYLNREGQSLLLIILDAGNFHHPKVCFTGAGYNIKELPDSEFQLSERSLKAHRLFIERGKDSFLSFYWIVIDKSVAHEWIEQKFKQLFYSLFNKKRIGLMIRMDIPAKEKDINNASIMAKEFVNDLSLSLKPEEADYILGKNIN